MPGKWIRNLIKLCKSDTIVSFLRNSIYLGNYPCPDIPLVLHADIWRFWPHFYHAIPRVRCAKNFTRWDKKWVNPHQPHTIFAPTNITVSICGRDIPSRFRHNHGNTPEGRWHQPATVSPESHAANTRIRWSTPTGASLAEPDRQRQRKQMESPEVPSLSFRKWPGRLLEIGPLINVHRPPTRSCRRCRRGSRIHTRLLKT